jgi:spore coat polysaccharide biosynthesis protein SpsF
VLGRVLAAAQESKAEIICELMGDSPLIDPLVIDLTIAHHLLGNYDYTSNFWPENTWPMGFSVQIYPVKLLCNVDSMAIEPKDRSHVTTFIYHNPRNFRLQGVKANTANHRPDIRLCLDTNEDYHLISTVYNELAPHKQEFSLVDIIELFLKNPQLLEINKHIIPKDIDEG